MSVWPGLFNFKSFTWMGELYYALLLEVEVNEGIKFIGKISCRALQIDFLNWIKIIIFKSLNVYVFIQFLVNISSRNSGSRYAWVTFFQKNVYSATFIYLYKIFGSRYKINLTWNSNPLPLDLHSIALTTKLASISYIQLKTTQLRKILSTINKNGL